MPHTAAMPLCTGRRFRPETMHATYGRKRPRRPMRSVSTTISSSCDTHASNAVRSVTMASNAAGSSSASGRWESRRTTVAACTP